jgi:Ca2+/Na+ antiporter
VITDAILFSIGVALLVFAVSRKRRVGRVEAAALLLIYAAYLGWRAGWIWSQPSSCSEP